MEFVEHLGLDPVLSGFNTFPVNPDLGTIENRTKAVQNKADIFVLIIGGRYGSLIEQKSVTNLEFLTAKQKGTPIYVFVDQSILSILPVWKENPAASFKSVVDNPKLFQFVSDILDSGTNWVYPFDTAQNIIDVLRTQLAFLFIDALELRLRASRSGLLAPTLRSLEGAALRLVIERPPHWGILSFYDNAR